MTSHLLTIIAVGLNGMLAGASLDQCVKQLPARRRIGVVAYAAYSRAADLGPGIAWYGILGIGAGIVTVAAATRAWLGAPSAPWSTTLAVAAALSTIQIFVTARVVTTTFRQCRYTEEADLRLVFDEFVRWQSMRAVVQILTLLASIWSLAYVLG
jgi:hypothetical protein